MYAGAMFGELVLLLDAPSRVTYRTTERCKLLLIPKTIFQEHITDYYLRMLEHTLDFYQ